MKLCVVGIGGAGGKVTEQFLKNEDIDSKLAASIANAQYISAGMTKGIWLEADLNDAKNLQHFFKDINKGAYPGFFIPHEVIEDGSDLNICVKDKYGYDVKKQGFMRDAQYMKAIFEIFDTDSEIKKKAKQIYSINGSNETKENSIVIEKPGQGTASKDNDDLEKAPNPIFDSAWKAIRPYTTLGGGDCDGILFIVSFGGGTGTGFINPIINHIRDEGKADYPVFVLGILTEVGDFADKAQFAKEGRRNLAAISAIYDLLTKSDGANGVILVDNQILMDRFKNDYAAANKFIHKIMLPMVLGRNYPNENLPGLAFAQNLSKGLPRPPLLVPLYKSIPRQKDPEKKLVKMALSQGKLFGCTPEKADFAVVFCRGYVDSKKIREALSAQIGIDENQIWVLRKIGDGNDEILILLRNPYGGDSEAYLRDGTLEKRFCRVISMALKHMNENIEDLFYEGKDSQKNSKEGKEEKVRLTPIAWQALSRFFFGPEGFHKDKFGETSGFAFELRMARRKLRDGVKPFFEKPLRIYERETVSPDEISEKEGRLSKDEISKINERLAKLEKLIK